MGGALGGDGADGQNCVSPVSVSLTFLTVLLVLVGDALLFPLPLGSAVEGLDLGGGGAVEPEGPAEDDGSVPDVDGLLMEVGIVDDCDLAGM